MPVNLLLDGRFLPTTACYGFVETTPERAVNAFTDVVARRLSMAPDNIVRRPVQGPLDRALSGLLPLRDAPTGDRFLLAPCDGQWTAYFENAASSGDPRIASGALPDILGCRTVLVYALPTTATAITDSLSTLGFSLAAPGKAGLLDSVRTLVVSRVDGKNEVQSYGERLPIENNDDESGLDLDRLDRYLRSLGIRAFDATFFLRQEHEGILLDAGHNETCYGAASQRGVRGQDPLGPAPDSKQRRDANAGNGDGGVTDQRDHQGCA